MEFYIPDLSEFIIRCIIITLFIIISIKLINMYLNGLFIGTYENECSDKIYSINKSLCTGCGNCEPECLRSAISKDGNTYSIDPTLCISCGICTDVCQESAIEIL